MRNRPDQIYRRSFTRLFIIAVTLTAFVGLTSVSYAQAQTTLRKIEILGLQRLSADEVIQSTGLRLGEPIDSSMIEAAFDKLMKTGLFRSVAYRVRTANDELTVVFEVTESAPRAPAAGELLGQVQWNGNRMLSAQELALAFGLRGGDPIDSAKVNKAIEAVRRAYARRGYISAVVLETRVQDATTRRVNYQFTIREGQQFRMGTLTINGLGPADVQRLKAKWTLAPGAVFNEGYLDEFKQTAVRPLLATMTQRTGARSKFEFETKPDVRKQTVDVVINFR